jgi:HPt (histidine-containing phosphotransfer) domain-containing protein
MLQELRDIQTDGSSDFIRKLMTVFMDLVPDRLRRLKEKSDHGDWVSLQPEAHALKASCFNVGAARMGELCEEIERASWTGQPESAAAAIAHLIAEFEVVKKEIQKLPEFTAPLA